MLIWYYRSLPFKEGPEFWFRGPGQNGTILPRPNIFFWWLVKKYLFLKIWRDLLEISSRSLRVLQGKTFFIHETKSYRYKCQSILPKCELKSGLSADNHWWHLSGDIVWKWWKSSKIMIFHDFWKFTKFNDPTNTGKTTPDGQGCFPARKHAFPMRFEMFEQYVQHFTGFGGRYSRRDH